MKMRETVAVDYKNKRNNIYDTLYYYYKITIHTYINTYIHE